MSVVNKRTARVFMERSGLVSPAVPGLPRAMQGTVVGVIPASYPKPDHARSPYAVQQEELDRGSGGGPAVEWPWGTAE